MNSDSFATTDQLKISPSASHTGSRTAVSQPSKQTLTRTADHWHNYPHDVVLLNFGGPTKESEVEPFLRRLFEDPFIIRAPIPDRLRQLLAKRIASKRQETSNQDYKAIGYSPINRYTQDQATLLEERLQQLRPNSKVYVVNRYTPPAAKEVIPHLRLGEARLFLLTLYPHTCHSTTVSSLRDFDMALRELHPSLALPSTRVFSWWHNPAYLKYKTTKLQEFIKDIFKKTGANESITMLFSAHGIPLKYDEKGDPYVNEIRAHAEELERRINGWLTTYEQGQHSGRLRWEVSFQSRVGPVEWVKPYTDKFIESNGQTGDHLALIPISFTSDHVETLFEMDVTYQDLALKSGYRSYQRLTAENADPEFADTLVNVLQTVGF